MGDTIMPSIIRATTTNGLQVAPDNSGSLQLQTNGTTTAVTIDTSQNVGIGTTTPSSYNAKLTVTGNIVQLSNNAYEPQQTMIGASSTAGAAPYFIFNRAKGTFSSPTAVSSGDQLGNLIYGGYSGTAYINTSGIWSVVDSTVTSTNVPSALVFGTGVTNSTERMRIDSSGNLLINTTSNIALSSRTVPLQILQNNNSQEAITIKANSSTYTFSSINFVNASGTQVGYIQMTASATSYITSSDYRLKENIAPMTGALDKVLQLKPVTYTWKQDGSDGQGFIAHELQAVVPDAVTGEKDAVDAEGNPKYQGIDTSFLVATLTAAIQEQQALIQSQAAAINDLKARITVLEAK
jgi:hypothetical protein